VFIGLCILLPLALQPAVGFGLLSNILPFFPICHQLSPSSLNRFSFFLCSTFVWVITLDLSVMGGPTSSTCYRQHSSWDHVTTQAPPQCQSRDTFRGIGSCIIAHICCPACFSKLNHNWCTGCILSAKVSWSHCQRAWKVWATIWILIIFRAPQAFIYSSKVWVHHFQQSVC
jgi:hypothetical protein